MGARRIDIDKVAINNDERFLKIQHKDFNNADEINSIKNVDLSFI